jgi:hypothetical protein
MSGSFAQRTADIREGAMLSNIAQCIALESCASALLINGRTDQRAAFVAGLTRPKESL